MTTAQALQAPAQAQPFRYVLAAEVRAHLGRQQLSGRALARRIGESPTWAARRLSGHTAMDADDLERIVDVLGISLSELLADAARRADTERGRRHAEGGVTGTYTPRFPRPCRGSHPTLSLVPDPTPSNRDVADSNGSSSPGTANGDGPTVLRSARRVA